MSSLDRKKSQSGNVEIELSQIPENESLADSNTNRSLSSNPTDENALSNNSDFNDIIRNDLSTDEGKSKKPVSISDDTPNTNDFDGSNKEDNLGLNNAKFKQALNLKQYKSTIIRWRRGINKKPDFLVNWEVKNGRWYKV